MASMFLEKEREEVKPKQKWVVGSAFLENLEVSGCIEIDLTADDDD